MRYLINAFDCNKNIVNPKVFWCNVSIYNLKFNCYLVVNSFEVYCHF